MKVAWIMNVHNVEGKVFLSLHLNRIHTAAAQFQPLCFVDQTPRAQPSDLFQLGYETCSANEIAHISTAESDLSVISYETFLHPINSQFHFRDKSARAKCDPSEVLSKAETERPRAGEEAETIPRNQWLLERD